MIGQVKTINGVKTVVPLSNEVATDSVTPGNMESVTSNAVANAMTGVFPDYTHKELITNTTSEYINNNYVMPENGMLIASGYGSGQANNYIYFVCNGVSFNQQGNSSENICNSILARKGESISITMKLGTRNWGLHFVPCK